MNSLRCIIVDDNELDRIIIANYFTHFPEFQLIEIFNHPLEALEAIKNELPDIIFLDVNMPEMTGLELRKPQTESNYVDFGNVIKYINVNE